MAIDDAAGTVPKNGYRVLARKYRPSSFADLIGQEAMVRTLRNAFETGRIAQGYMLTGVRGVGKTTTARILARALNYETETVDRPTLDMTREGRHCRAIMESRHPDVLEMDAASHTGIDDVRAIIENAQYRPIEARMKVFIIDEVHMLSKAAFNSLLKTLEEPPSHVKFIFATTEIRKVPITILSRCQRFDLRRIEAGDVVTYLADVCAKEGVAAEGAALGLIARAGEGSMRDALSLLDQAIAYGQGRVEEHQTRDMLGLADRGRVIALFEAVSRGDVTGALAEMKAQHDLGADPAVVIGDLLDVAYLVTRLKTVPAAAKDPQLTQDERERGGALAQTLSLGMLTRAWQMLLKGLDEVRLAPRPLDAADMILVRLAHASTLPTPEEAMRVLQGETLPELPRTPELAANDAAPAAAWEERPTPAEARPAPRREGAFADLRPLYELAERAKNIRLAQALWSDGRLASADARHLRVAGLDDAIARDLQTRLKEWTGEIWTIEPIPEAEAPTLKEMAERRRLAEIEAVKSDPNVAAVLSTFPDAEVEAVLDDEDEDAA